MINDRGLLYAELLRLRSEYKAYRDAHWDSERNMIRPEFAEGLYRLFREGKIVRKMYDECIKALEPKVLEPELNFNNMTA